MSKRMFALIVVGSLLILATGVYAQDAPIRFLSEAQINESFTLPSIATRTISNLKVDVRTDGVHLTFDMTVTRDGTSNTFRINAILIGLQVHQLELQNPMVSNFEATRTQRSEVAGLVQGAWQDYMTGVFGDLATDLIAADGIIMRDGGICNPRWGC